MARLKLLVFSLAVLGLWAAHLYLLSPGISARAVEQSQERAATLPAAVKAKLAERRMELQRVALKAASNAAALAALKTAGKDAPTAELVTQLRASLSDAVPQELRSTLVVAVANEAGSMVARGTAAPAQDPSVDMAALVQAGVEGVARDAFGQSHFFYSVPAASVSGGEAKTFATVVVGAPLVGEGMLDQVAKQHSVEGLGLIQDGKVISAGGEQKKAISERGAKVIANTGSVFEYGSVASLGPLKLPFLTSGSDMMGGNAPVRVAYRSALEATPFEVVAVISSGQFMAALGEYQRQAVFGFAALVVLTAVFMLVMGAGRTKDLGASEQEALSPAEKAITQAKEEGTNPGIVPPPVEPAQAEAGSSAAEAQSRAQSTGATQDDFPFREPPPAAPEQPQWPSEEPQQASPAFGEALFADGLKNAAQAPLPQGSFPQGSLDDEQPTRAAPMSELAAFTQFDNQATMAYPANADPFELASRQEAPVQDGGDFNPEATKVAAIPDELLRASARAETGSTSIGMAAPRSSAASYAPPPIASSVQAVNALNEDTHFQEVFREFLRTREQCGEPQDGLTLEKFSQKLRKNKEQLVAKYACKTVRFQVYVKEGKAALKATPIKD